MPNPGNFDRSEWVSPQTLAPKSYTCGYCGRDVSSEKGFKIITRGDTHSQKGGVFMCPQCRAPTYFPPNEARQIPGSSFGHPVSHVPGELNALYEEARSCIAGSNFTAAVLVCRKMLMNIGVQQGAAENGKFIEYVDYLSQKGFVPPHGKHWVDHIRRKGNEANHEITLMNDKDAKELLVFMEMLLKFIYEFPNLVPKEATA
jgi:DNA-directed RNA polymerase subunit RPC12/RpoP